MKYTLGLVALLSAVLLSFNTAHAGVFTGTDPYDVTIKTTTNTAVVSIKVIADASSYSLSICKGDSNNRRDCIDTTRINTSNGTGTKTFTYNNLSPGTLYTMFVQGGHRGYYEFSTDKAFTSTSTGNLSFQTTNNALGVKITISAQDKNTSYYVYYYNTLASADNINGARTSDAVAIKPGETRQFTSTMPTNELYYGRLVGKDAAGNHTFLSPPVETVLFYTRKIDFKTSGDKATATGYINTSKHTNFRDFTATIYVSKGTILTATGNEQADAFYTTSNQAGINEDGSYKITISNLDENTLYYFRHVISSPAGTKDAIADSFNSTQGYVPAGSIEKGNDFDKRSYHLLAPFPGLTAVLDPDLCREQQKEGKLGAGQVCGINDFINLMLKLLVGITAVLLVIRIVIEGYNYVVTDVPFLKVSAKTHIFESTFGLVLALSSFLILNTINPKLVSSDITIRQEEIEIELVGDGTGNITINGKLPSGVYCPNAGKSARIPEIAKSFVGKVSYSMNERGKMRSDGDINLDCSSYVAQVLTCAGYSVAGVTDSGTNTSTIQAKSEKVTATEIKNGQLYLNNTPVKTGDVFGWTTPQKNRHVVMSMGGTKIIDVHGGVGNTDNAKEMDISYYLKKYKIQFVYRISS